MGASSTIFNGVARRGINFVGYRVGVFVTIMHDGVFDRVKLELLLRSSALRPLVSSSTAALALLVKLMSSHLLLVFNIGLDVIGSTDR